MASLLGAPTLFGNVNAAINNVTVLTADLAMLLEIGRDAQWGIFDRNSNAVLKPDTILSVDLMREYSLCDAPQESGAFTTYNKVKMPYTAKVKMAIGGSKSIFRTDSINAVSGKPKSNSPKTQFLAKIAAICADTNLYYVLTPDYTFPNVNIYHYSYTRSAKSGAEMLIVDIWLREVRITNEVVFASSTPGAPAGSASGSSSSPSATDPQSSGAARAGASQATNGVQQPPAPTEAIAVPPTQSPAILAPTIPGVSYVAPGG